DGDGYDLFRSALVQNFPWRNAEDETEDWNSSIDDAPHLLRESRRRYEALVGRPRCVELVYVRQERCERFSEIVFAGLPCAFVFHRHPQIDSEWSGGEGADLIDHVADCLRIQTESAEAAESAKVGDSGDQSLRRKTAERSLDDWIVDAELRRQQVLSPI